MADPVISPDGKYILVDGEWVSISGQEVKISDSAIAGDVSIESNIHINMNSNLERKIRNLAEIFIEKLGSMQMKSALEIYTEAKKIDHAISKELFEGEYSVRIGRAYADIVETYLVDIVSNKIDVGLNDFYRPEVKGHYKASALLDMIEIAFNNALAFLGDPDEITIGGLPINELSDIIDEFGTIDVDSTGFKELKDLEFLKKPTEESVKQKYRIGLALETAALSIYTDLQDVEYILPYDDINRKFIETDKPAYLYDSATVYTIKVVAIAVHEGFDISSWSDEYSEKLSMLRNQKKRFQENTARLLKKLLEMEKKLAENREKIRIHQQITAQQNQQTSDCFIATAAYGTEYEMKINVLRCWRDTKLLKSKYFSPFVKIYYKKSPPIANYISNRPFMKTVVRIMLAPIIFAVKFTVRNEYHTWTDEGNPL